MLNGWFFPTMILALALFWLGEWLWRQLPQPVVRANLMLDFFLLALPGLLFPLYYTRLFDHAVWFYQFRALPGTELAASGAGLFAGFLFGACRQWKPVSRGSFLALLVLGIAIPYLKPLLRPLPASRFQDNWKNGVCLQSTSASCGVASAATLLASFGIKVSEAELARECFTCSTGTEAWYLARMFRRRGFDVVFHVTMPADGPPAPAIAGIDGSGFGHFIPIIAKDAAGYTTGDPLDGRRQYAKEQLGQQLQFTGFFLEIRRKKPAEARL